MKTKASKADMVKDQHLMVNKKSVEKIVSAARLERQDRVLEIGAGAGILTRALAMKGARVIAVEIDRSFRKVLGKIESGNVEIIYGNALEVMDGLAFDKVVSNIPYSICEPLINKLMARNFSLAVLSVPEKFYRILSAGPRERGYSLLTLRASSFFSVALSFRLKREDFDPPPQTESVVITIRPLADKDYAKRPDKFIFRELLLQRKKKLKNALMEGIINLNKKILSRAFTKNMAKKVISAMGLERSLLEKESGQLTLADLEKIREKIRHFS
jgi:16S rRNA (adenine1518-N6/adenine1519-N6)-dimethyltransferase